MFAALVVLAVMAVTLHRLVDAGVRRLMPWQTETFND
jgi:ABC-type nitrate/sulfonate/bicarbonate transport system permease component